MSVTLLPYPRWQLNVIWARKREKWDSLIESAHHGFWTNSGPHWTVLRRQLPAREDSTKHARQHLIRTSHRTEFSGVWPSEPWTHRRSWTRPVSTERNYQLTPTKTYKSIRRMMDAHCQSLDKPWPLSTKAVQPATPNNGPAVAAATIPFRSYINGDSVWKPGSCNRVTWSRGPVTAWNGRGRQHKFVIQFHKRNCASK